MQSYPPGDTCEKKQFPIMARTTEPTYYTYNVSSEPSLPGLWKYWEHWEHCKHCGVRAGLWRGTLENRYPALATLKECDRSQSLSVEKI